MASLPSATTKPTFARFDATKPSTTPQTLIEAIKRDGGVIVENFISQQLTEQIKADLKSHFDTDTPDKSGFFPVTTQRATGLFNISDACVELGCNPLYIDVANAFCSSTFTRWVRDERVTTSAKPIISSTVAFRVNPGGDQQVLHRDDEDYHPHDKELPVMIGCVTALTRTTKENGATIGIPGSHLWDSDRRPYDHEAVPAELNPGDSFIFLGNLYHAGGRNITQNEYRETVGIFLCKPTLRPAENQFLMVPLERTRQLKPQAQRLLGYGICKPYLGFMNYQDPMKVLFGVEDEETVVM